MDADRVELGELLDGCAARWRSRVVDACAAAGFPEVTATTCAVLRPLFERDGLPISEVGERAGLAKSSMTTIVRPTRPESRTPLTTRRSIGSPVYGWRSVATSPRRTSTWSCPIS